MKNIILTLFLFGAVLSATPVNVTLLNAGNGAIDSTGQYYVGPYTLAINGVATPGMCMDDFVENNIGDKWSANLTVANSTNLSATYLGTSGTEMINGHLYTSSQIYTQEAYLFSLIIKPGADQADIQEAAWVLMDPSNPTYSSNPGVQKYLTAAADNAPSFDASDYVIVSDVKKFGAQEFMIDTPAPEPVSIALLGGGLLIIGTTRLRRSKQSTV